MNVTYEYKPEMTFIGFSTSVRPDEGYIKCPEFWDKEYAQKYARLWQTRNPETPIEKALLENQIGMFAICNEKEDRKRMGGVFRKGCASHFPAKAEHSRMAGMVSSRR